MKIYFDFSQTERRTTVTASREEYDAPILAPVEIFAAPFLFNHDRLHVAAALLFHREVSGEIALEESIRCSRHVAIQIERYFDPVDVIVRNQSFSAIACPSGSYVTPVYITVNEQPEPIACNTGQGEMLMRFVPEGVGSMFSETEVVIGTNLRQGHDTLDASIDEIIRIIGGGILFAEELQISGFRLPGEWQTVASKSRLTQVEALLSTVGLALEWGGPS